MGGCAKHATIDFVNKYHAANSKFDLVRPAECNLISPFVHECVAPRARW